MVIHKEFALRRFCEFPLKHEGCRELLEKICSAPDQLKKLVFVTTRDYLPNTMVVSQRGSAGVPFELSLGSQSEQLILVSGGLLGQLCRATADSSMSSLCSKGTRPIGIRPLPCPTRLFPLSLLPGLLLSSGSR